MRTRDDFTPDHPLPVFLSDETYAEAELYGELRRSSWLLKAGLSVVVAAVIALGAAMSLSLGYPMKLFAEASETDPPAAQPIADQSTPTALPNRSTVDAGQTVGSAPGRDKVADTSAPASDSQAESREPPTGALLKQFQSWAAAQDNEGQDRPTQPAQDGPTQVEPVRPIQDTTTQVEPVRPKQDAATQAEPVPPVQDTQTQDSQDNPAPVRAIRKHRKGPTVQNARAEVRTAKPPQAGSRRYWNARGEARPAQDARAPQDPRAPEQQPAQNGQSPSLLQNLGLSH